MSVAEIIGSLIGLLTFAGSVAGVIYAYGRLNEKVKDHGEEMLELKTRLSKAESDAHQVQGLATAIEHMGSRFADQVKHLIETFAIENGHTRQQLADIKDEVRHVRNMGVGQPQQSQQPRRRRTPQQ